jgi:LemA protein
MRKNKMANGLDEFNDPVSTGRDVNVINKQIPVKVGVGSTIFQVLLWVCGIIPGLIFTIMKVKAATYLRQLEQKLQHDASQIDNYLEQRVVILQNCAKLLDKAIDLDKTTFENIAKYRGGNTTSDATRNEVSSQLDAVGRQINVAFENYPDLKAHQEIADAMQQNNYLQREITAAREVYNDTVNRWNQDIQAWPTKMIVAAKQGYTTRVPFSTTNEVREKAREVLF